MLLETLFPTLPTTLWEILIHVCALLAAAGLFYGVSVEKERRQDLIYLLSASALLVYAIYIGNLLFIIAMGVFALTSAVEFVQILMGLHKHDPAALKKYKEMK